MIALDTGILIYGSQSVNERRSEFTQVQISRTAAASWLLRRMGLAGELLVIPAPAAWEYVLDFKVERQIEVWNGFAGAAIAPFDQAAARIAARISRTYSDRLLGRPTRKCAQPTIGARQQIKVDIQILSIAIAQRAEAIYTLEVERFAEWAQGEIEVLGIDLPST